MTTYPTCYYSPYPYYSYSSWWAGDVGCTRSYYSSWRSGWYGGFSYVYNPWPVYRTYYLYETVPVLTRTETVYVSAPVVSAPVDAAPVAAASATVAVTPQPAVITPAVTPSAWQAAPAEVQVDVTLTGCFCACRCDGQRDCMCDYPCGAEYALLPDEFDLSLAFVSYTEVPHTETVWAAYAGIDRMALELQTLSDPWHAVAAD